MVLEVGGSIPLAHPTDSLDAAVSCARRVVGSGGRVSGWSRIEPFGALARPSEIEKRQVHVRHVKVVRAEDGHRDNAVAHRADGVEVASRLDVECGFGDGDTRETKTEVVELVDRAGGAPERRGEGGPGGPFQAPPRAPRCEPLMMASFHSQTLPPWSEVPFALGEVV